MQSFQEIILTLQNFWTKNHCLLQQGHDLESGAGTFNPDTFLRSLGPEPFGICNVEICRRPTDGRYGKNPNRLQKFHQFQVILKPCPDDFQALYLQSLVALGFDLSKHDIRFVHDDWESPTQGAWGLGWEVWCDGMEITQYTYFQAMGGIEVDPIVGELAYGLERIAMFLQNKDNVYDIAFNNRYSYGDVFKQYEIEGCHYNFEQADTEMLSRHFEEFEKESNRMLAANLPTVAYDFAIRASHTFNLLDARSAISTTARVDLIHRIRNLCCQAAKGYVESRRQQGFPLLTKKTETKKNLLPPLPTLPHDPNTTEDLLFEIGSEEVPASFLPTALLSFEKLLRDLLSEHNLSYSSLETFATPRRLAVHIKDLPAGTPETTEQRKGPTITIAFDKNGEVTKQGKGFLSSLGLNGDVTLTQIKEGKFPELTIKEDKYLFASTVQPSKSTAEILREALPQLIAQIKFQKRMRWSHSQETYARPIRWLTLLYGKTLIPIAYGQVISSHFTYGHAQLSPKPIKLTHPKQYKKRLKKHWVIACVNERKKLLEKQLDKWSAKYKAIIPERERVLSEVLFLSEYPQIASSDFEAKFLELPPELLISEMIDHQRYFPLESETGHLLNYFLVALDRKPTKLILRNNSAVLRARLSDGHFLIQQDLGRSLESMNHALKHVSFHKKLGSMYDKALRIKKRACALAKYLHKEPPDRAAELCKADLASSVVYEFPDLQGIMGRFYALKSGESEETAVAIEQHWWPVTEGGAIPTTEKGAILSLADKLDNLESYLSIGIQPSSSKDPYALRRSAIGIVRILIERRYTLSLSEITTPEVTQFILQRLKNLLGDYGFAKEEIGAILAGGQTDPYDLYCRAAALHQFRATDQDAFALLLEVYKRARGQVETLETTPLESAYLQEEAEKTLHSTLMELRSDLKLAMDEKEYLKAYKLLTKLSPPLSTFFDQVRVLTDDDQLRTNRLALLSQVAKTVSSTLELQHL